MTDRRLGIVLFLLTPFVLGFLIGFLVRGCFTGGLDDGTSAMVEAIDPDELTEAELPEMELSEAERKDETTAEGSTENSDSYEEPPAREVFYNGKRLAYSKLFPDANELHLKAADSLGLKDIPSTREDVKFTKGLVMLEDNSYYRIDKLRYSAPYLTQGGKRALDNIAIAFSDSLKQKGLLNYKLIVTSGLRTKGDIIRLRRSGNPNASEKSAHCYGTTFDITYTKYFIEDESEAFMRPYELTKVLGEVLRDQRRQGNCLIKYEKKEHCFHITSLL